MEVNVNINSTNEISKTVKSAEANDAQNLPVITDVTTLGELIGMLNLGEKPNDTPTPKKLRETAGEPIAVSKDPLGYGEGSKVYANGYAVYDNGSGRTVIWLPDCTSFTYFFVQPKETEVGICPAKTALPEGMLESQPWAIPVTLIGEHRIDANLMNRMGSRTGTTDFDSSDNGDKDGDAEAKVEESYQKEHTWHDGRFGEDPLDCLLREERQREMLESMTDKQREVFVMHYREGYTQQEMADIIGATQQAVDDRLSRALERVKIFLSEPCKRVSPTTVYERT